MARILSQGKRLPQTEVRCSIKELSLRLGNYNQQSNSDFDSIWHKGRRNGVQCCSVLLIFVEAHFIRQPMEILQPFTPGRPHRPSVSSDCSCCALVSPRQTLRQYEPRTPVCRSCAYFSEEESAKLLVLLSSPSCLLAGRNRTVRQSYRMVMN